MGQGSILPPARLRVIESGVGAVPLVAPTPVPSTAAGSVTQVPAVVNLACYAGDDFSFDLPVVNPDASLTDFTGATFLSQIRQRPESTTVAATFAVTAGSGATSNVLTLKLLGADSQLLGGAYVWDCQVTYASTAVSTVAAGGISILPDVSH